MTETDNTQPSLEHLMALAQAGDKRAYADLLRTITPILKAFITNKINNPADVDDVLQEILISIHNASHTYDTDRPFKAWMFAIARYRLADYLRKLYRKGLGTEVSFDELAPVLPDQKVTESWEEREYLGKMLDSLPEKQRTIVTMMKIEGYTAEETAKAMNMKPSAVKVAAHRAYKALAKKAKEEEKEEERRYGHGSTD